MPNVYQLIPRNITDTSVDIQVISYTSPSTTISDITIGVRKSGGTAGVVQTLHDPGTNQGQTVGTLTFNSLTPRTQYSTTITGGTAISLITFTTLTSPDTPRTATQAQWENLASRVDSANNKIKSIAGAPTTSTVGAKGMLLEDTTNGKLYQCTAIDTTDPQNPSYTWSEVGAGGGSSVNVVQTTGTSQTDVMSQDAVSDMIFAYNNSPQDNYYSVRIGAKNGYMPTGSTNQYVAIGQYIGYEGHSNTGYCVSIGYNTGVNYCSTGIGASNKATGIRSSSFGNGATATATGSIALGASSNATVTGQCDIGSTNTSYGYNSSNYRLLTGLYDPQSAHDAATKGYVDGKVLSNAGTPTTATVGTVGQLCEDTTNGKLYQCTAVTPGTDPDPDTYTWEEVGGSAGPTVVQTPGNSTTNVMSQDATTSMVFTDPSTRYQVRIGGDALVTASTGGIAIGRQATANNTYAVSIGPYSQASAVNGIAIGYSSRASKQDSVGIGSYANPSRAGEVNVGTGTHTYGYNSTSYRVIGGVHDGVDNHDAATVGQLNSSLNSRIKILAGAPTTSTVGVLGQLYTDTTNMHTYQCTAIDTTDPDNPSYTWTQRW